MLLILLALILFWITMQTVSLISAFLTTFGLRIELLLLAIWFKVHSKVIKLFCSCKVLRLFLFFLKEFIWSVLSVYHIFPLLYLLLLLLDSTTEMFFMFFIILDSDIIIIKINEWSFLIGSKKVIFLLIIDSFERLDSIIIERRWSKICWTSMSTFKILFK